MLIAEAVSAAATVAAAAARTSGDSMCSSPATGIYIIDA